MENKKAKFKVYDAKAHKKQRDDYLKAKRLAKKLKKEVQEQHLFYSRADIRFRKDNKIKGLLNPKSPFKRNG